MLVFIVFLSTPSARRATWSRLQPKMMVLFLSTPSARRATGWDWQRESGDEISIHALREEGDSCPKDGRLATCISIPALREEGDTTATRPARGPRISIPALREEGD